MGIPDAKKTQKAIFDRSGDVKLFERNFDYIVAGAGNGGLGAALTLAKAGKKVLLIEQHNLPGGCATSFTRGRFEFDPSLHELCSVGPESDPGNIRTLFEDLDVSIDWVRIDDCFRVISTFSDGTPMDVTMPSGRTDFINKMEEYVPGSKPGMEKMFRLFDETTRATDYFLETKKQNVRYMIKNFPNFLKVGSYSVRSVFSALRLPQKVQDILSTYWTYLGVPLEHLSFFHYTNMVKTYVEKGAYIPRYRSHELSVKMIERFRKMGGTVLFNTRVESFTFENGKISGVKTNRGNFNGTRFIANINPDIVYGHMIPKQYVPSREKRLITARKGRYGARMIGLYVGLDKTAEELGIRDYSLFMPGGADSAVEYSRIMHGMKTNEYMVTTCPNIAIPDFSPEGTCVYNINTLASKEEWSKLEEKDYFSFKNMIAEKLLTQLRDRAGIDLFGHIEELTVATPWTFARYVGVPEGAVYGHETNSWDGIMARHMASDRESIPGLRIVGASGKNGAGYGCAYLSGVEEATAMLRSEEAGEEVARCETFKGQRKAGKA